MQYTAAIIIPHFEDPMRLSRAVRAIAPQLSGVVDIELIVVDNDSACDLSRLKTIVPSLRIVTEPQKGAANARNRGVAETTAPVLAFLDADCVPSDNWIQRVKELGQSLNGADVVGGQVNLFDETPPPRNGAEAFETVFAFDNRHYVQAKGFSVTANLITRREVFQDVGPMRAGLSEDLEWCHRATRAGYRIAFDEHLVARHPTRSDWPALRRKWKRLTQEMFALRPSSIWSRLSWGVRALFMGPSVLWHIPRVWRHEALTPREKFRALSTLVKLRMIRCLWMLRQALTGKSRLGPEPD